MVRERGRWTVDSYGECRPSRVVNGMEVPRWDLRRRASPDDRVIQMVVDTGSCHPDRARQDVRRRFDHVELREASDGVELTVFIREDQVGEGNVCAGVGVSYPIDVRLPEPRGDRPLLDGSSIPARRVAERPVTY